MTAFASSVTLVLVGAAAGLVPTLVVDVLRNRRETRTRWDETLLTAASDLVEAARTLLHMSQRMREDRVDYADKLDEVHIQLRALVERVKFIGDDHVRTEAELVRRHAYAARLVGEGRPDPRGDEYADDPFVRLHRQLDGFAEAVRRQLQVAAGRGHR
ncbi:hypothetical protein [Curtobacterium sp. MCBD17_028]|uniref:hypothetical protein n=1 Tax=Curtobacterium sp. MCBD17_028 TaxID=2175670 RepID=UPI000DA8C101|nr:hypothetical protein [Curtobacterium sp. MCBD17_028]PZE24553.1 hypothetical protein DEI86_12305 [Curtobacterium sp. MCBD17_028]